MLGLIDQREYRGTVVRWWNFVAFYEGYLSFHAFGLILARDGDSAPGFYFNSHFVNLLY